MLESTLTVQNKTMMALGGPLLPALDSVSLRLQKMVNIAQRVSDTELKDVCAKAEKSKKTYSQIPAYATIPGAATFTMKLAGRMMVNHAGGVLENANLCLHRHLGFPMIPGSALKGIARHAAWCDWLAAAEGKQEGQAREIAHRIAVTFGYPTGDTMPENPKGRTRPQQFYLDDFLDNVFPDDFGKDGTKTTLAGSVSFLAAVPADKDWCLTVDVLTSHTGGDKKNPIPVFFPAVENATFQFSVAPVNGRSAKENLDFALEYLKKGLSEIGVGAKTAAGYGWFDAESCADVINRSSLSAEELNELAVVEVSAMSFTGLEEHVDTLNERDDAFRKIYLERLFREKGKLVRKWKEKGNPRFELLRQIAEKLNMEMP